MPFLEYAFNEYVKKEALFLIFIIISLNIFLKILYCSQKEILHWIIYP